MLKHLGGWSLGAAIVLWVVASVLFLGPIYHPECQWYYQGESYQERVTSLGCLFAGLLSDLRAWISDRDVLAGIFAAVSAAATGFIAWFTYTLQQSTHRLWKITTRAVKVAERDLVISSRAFVFLGGLTPEFFSNSAGITGLVLKPSWKNSGDTQTKNLSVNVAWVDADGDLPADFEYPYQTDPLHLLVAPNDTEWSEPINIPDRIAIAASNGTRRLYIWGRAEYDDIFGSPRRRFTQFCYRTHVTHGGETQILFIAYGNYNRSDEDDN